jgi:DNA-directed RNA polymerase sigma subunit (sigma70/sigma32)
MEYSSLDIKNLLIDIQFARIKRNELIIERHKAGETLQAIADSYGISRQRVHQIVKKELSHDHQNV